MSDKENIRKLLLEAMNTNDPETFVDEDEFIKDSDKIKKNKANGTKKARKCANCVCGKYEDEPVPVKKSECGNCYKGDAFRCSGCPSCPSLGLPPYKKGDVVNFDDVEDDI